MAVLKIFRLFFIPIYTESTFHAVLRTHLAYFLNSLTNSFLCEVFGRIQKINETKVVQN